MLEYLSENMWQLWAVVAVLGLILELSSGDFFILCFSIGAVGAGIVSPFANIYIQICVFAAVTAVSIFTVRPFALRYLHKGEDNRASNADALIGREGRVTEEIRPGEFGRVAIDGDNWKAESAVQEILPVGTQVKVISRKSIIILVDKV
jgi:membrane protein implicated in regulation of membrane protease activity